MREFSLATACRAAGFAAAAYRTPAVTPTTSIDGSTIAVFNDVSRASSELIDGARCSCYTPSGAYERFAFIDNQRTSTQAEVWTSRDGRGAVVLSFRGTEVRDPRDLATDIFATQRQIDSEAAGMPGMLPGGVSLVHSGFGRAYGSVRAAILEVLTMTGTLGGEGGEDGSASGTLLLTGHSLGGALALLAARELGVALGPRLSIYTFGAPRIGNTALAAEILRGTAQCDGPWRVVNFDDFLVPRFPRGTPANRLFDYVHAGATVLLPAAEADEPLTIRVAPIGDARGCPLKEVNPRYRGIVPPLVFEWSSTNLPRFVLAEVRSVWRLVTRGGVREHYMTAYDERLCRLAAGEALALVSDDGGEGGVRDGDSESEDAGAGAGQPPDPPLEYLDLLQRTWGD